MPVIRDFALVDRRENIYSHQWRTTQSGELTLLMAPVDWDTDNDARVKKVSDRWQEKKTEDNGT
jgi:hypothetical protein